MKGITAGGLLTLSAVVIGFAVGFGVGQKTRNAANSNISTQYSDGKVVITADVTGAVKAGVGDYLSGLTG